MSRLISTELSPKKITNFGQKAAKKATLFDKACRKTKKKENEEKKKIKTCSRLWVFHQGAAVGAKRPQQPPRSEKEIKKIKKRCPILSIKEF